MSVLVEPDDEKLQDDDEVPPLDDDTWFVEEDDPFTQLEEEDPPLEELDELDVLELLFCDEEGPPLELFVCVADCDWEIFCPGRAWMPATTANKTITNQINFILVLINFENIWAIL